METNGNTLFLYFYQSVGVQ